MNAIAAALPPANMADWLNEEVATDQHERLRRSFKMDPSGKGMNVQQLEDRRWFCMECLQKHPTHCPNCGNAISAGVATVHLLSSAFPDGRHFGAG